MPIRRIKLVAGPIILPLLVAISAVVLLLRGLFSTILHAKIWWAGKQQIFFVYSDSPVWHDHIHQTILPKLENRSVILNWSNRSKWRMSIGKTVFNFFGGHYEFCPMAVVFRRFRRTHVFRFWKPFCEYKNGRPESLIKMESDFFALIDSQSRDADEDSALTPPLSRT